MATKTLSVSEEAYQRLKKLKKDGESFTDVIIRVTGKRPLREFYGVLDEEHGEKLKAVVEESRESSRRFSEERKKRLEEAFRDLS